MAICEFCLEFTKDGKCAIGLDLRKGMTCREFRPGMEKFCSDPKDFVNPSQIVQMANYFGIGRTELKKVKLMATRAEIRVQRIADDEALREEDGNLRNS